ncbi:ThiF family adenylyltransferase [Dyella japonica]|uniref:Thiamine biosynthesis protein ThiF n=1 Tax=Dyella japonica TaxID=231455 RepID=A0ABV2JS34_9GAMM
MAFLECGLPLSGDVASLPVDSPFLALLRACEKHPDVDVVELRRAPDGESWHAIVVDIGDGTVAARNDVGIHPRERLALVHRPGASMPFEARPLRSDFPETLHQNGVLQGELRSLCLYDVPWSSLERTWTPGQFLTRVLQWLEKTADGTLHARDQALEQLFFDSGWRVLLPVGFGDAIQDQNKTLRLRLLSETAERVTLAASFDVDESTPGVTPPLQLLTFEISGVTHPPVQYLPKTLGDLEDRLVQVGTSVFPALIEELYRLAAGEGLLVTAAESRINILMLIRIPRLRDGVTERLDVLAFLVETDLARLGLAMGVLYQGQPGGHVFRAVALQGDVGQASSLAVTPSSDWRDIRVTQMHVRHRVDRAAARGWSGLPEGSGKFRGLLAGAGALGSTLALLWAREGWGSWTLVDPDMLDPHNVVRHQAFDISVGRSKSEVVGALMQSALGERDPQLQTIRGKANDCEHEALVAAIASADLLIDATTSLEVPRDWSLQDVPRTASVFLTPSGGSSVLLIEDAAKHLRVAALEAQYYRAVLRQEWGEAHLQSTAEIRVGAGCRDRSLVMSATRITLHGALLNQGLQRAAEASSAAIRVWSLDGSAGSVHCYDVPPCEVRQSSAVGWTIYWDVDLESHLQSLRALALPNETGGILVGVTDHKARTIYLVDAYHAPLDSVATPREFIRGKEGVADLRLRCVTRTRGMVDYVGDWHSHPRHASARPSQTDLKLVDDLAQTLSADGVPAIMVIAGDKGSLTITLRESH